MLKLQKKKTRIEPFSLRFPFGNCYRFPCLSTLWKVRRMYGKSRRALMLITVFLVSIMSPLTTPIEPAEAHYDEPSDPPLRVQVYLNKLYSTEDYDD